MGAKRWIAAVSIIVLGWFAALVAALVVALVVTQAQQQKKGKAAQKGAAAEPDYELIPTRDISQAEGNLVHPTPRQECRSLITDSQGRLWTLGVESNGGQELNATRQFIALGRFADVHWTPVQRVRPAGFVFSPAAAPDKKGGLWISWSEFDDKARSWFVKAAYFDGRSLGAVQRVTRGNGPDLRPAVVVEAGGDPLIAFESGENHRFALRAASYRDGRWSDELLTSTDSNFRPFLTVDREGRTWLAWDRFTAGDYDVLVRARENGSWKNETLFFASAQDEQRPTLRVAADNTLWVMASGRLAGIRNGQRVALKDAPRQPSDEFFISGDGRFWFIRGIGGAGGNPRTGMQVTVLGGQAPRTASFEMPLGYRAPFLDAENRLWTASDATIYRLAQGIPAKENGAVATQSGGALAETKQPGPPSAHAPHETIRVGAETYTLFLGEQHTHLGENPTDRTLEIWPDRFYLKAMSNGVLDFGASSDHDWPLMTGSKFKTEQAYATVFTQDRQFLAFTGYEWSGDNYRRRRFGDRTIVFPGDYMPIFRITDPESDNPEKLHQKLKSIGAIDWAHHVGAPFAVMDWTTHDPVIEPVMETVSQHGVYETYDRANAVPVWLTKPPVGQTSIQDGLGAGHRFGLVGSSDSHNGISGYPQGMLGMYAKSLTRADIMDAFRQRRTFAIRGGEPMLVEFRMNNEFMGREIRSNATPRATVHVKAHSPIRKIEIVRDGKYIFSKTGDRQQETSFDFSDTEKGKYYYVRVWLEGDQKFAWTSPVWVD